MVNKKTLAGGIIILLIWAFALPEKGDFTYFFNKRLLDWVQRYPQEKVYLHTDRDHYEVGDKVWFRAYLLNAVAHTPSEWSRYVYVELRDLRDSLYARVKIAPQKGVYAGYLPLTKDLPQGDFVLRAYSYWMQNAGDDFIFRKNNDFGLFNAPELYRDDHPDISVRQNFTDIHVFIIPSITALMPDVFIS